MIYVIMIGCGEVWQLGFVSLIGVGGEIGVKRTSKASDGVCHSWENNAGMCVVV